MSGRVVAEDQVVSAIRRLSNPLTKQKATQVTAPATIMTTNFLFQAFLVATDCSLAASRPLRRSLAAPDNYCGLTWTDAAQCTSVVCPNGLDSECPPGETCYEGITSCSEATLSSSKASALSGFCNWGPDGTAETSVCEGGAEGGEWCNASESNCESGCSGRWCSSSGGGSLTPNSTLDFVMLSPDATVPVSVGVPDTTIGTVFIYNDALFDLNLTALPGTFVAGLCTRTQLTQNVGGDNTLVGGGYCHFTFTVSDGVTSVSFNAAGEVFDVLGGTLSVAGGTGELVGVYGEVELVPVYQETNQIDFFTEASVYVGTASLFVPLF